MNSTHHTTRPREEPLETPGDDHVDTRRSHLHPISHRLRQVLVLRESLEFHFRREMGLGGTDYALMSILFRNGALTPAQLADHLHMTRAAITTSLDRLAQAGHIRRSSDASDGRRKVITANPASQRQAMGIIMPMVFDTDDAVHRYSPEEQAVITRYLDDVIRSMERRLRECEEEFGTGQTSPRRSEGRAP